MSFAIYGESLGYVHLVTAEDQDSVLRMFFDDVKSCNVQLEHIGNIYAVEGKDECLDLQDAVNKAIQEARNAAVQ